MIMHMNMKYDMNTGHESTAMYVMSNLFNMYHEIFLPIRMIQLQIVV